MLEVVFNDSEKGLLKVAKQDSSIGVFRNVIGYIGEDALKDTEIILINQQEGKELQGSSGEVVSIGFALDLGDISGDVDGVDRKDVFRKLWSCFDFNPKEVDEFFKAQREDMKKLLQAAKKGTPIRIWKSDAPYSVCGFAYVCYLLRNVGCKLSVISLPEYGEKDDNMLVSYAGWGELEPSQLSTFLPLEKRISTLEKKYYCQIWQGLVAENAPLRAVVNGKLISVSEGFYDDIIARNIPDEEALLARVIGNILGKYQLGISDCWIALRINKMINEQKIIITGYKDKSHPYGKIIKKAFV